MSADKLGAVFELVLAVALLLSLGLLFLPPDKAQRVVRLIKKLLFGGRD